MHGEAFDFYRDDKFDSRNYFNPEPNPKSPFNRKQFGVNLGGPIEKNKTFYFFSYEGLRHTQGVDLNAGVLTEAQRAAVTDPVSRNLLPYIPLGNTDGRQRPGAAARVGHRAGQHRPVHASTCATTSARNDDLHGYYAYQKDLRQEPNAQGNTVPGFGDTRGGHRQVLTVNETHVFSPALVNEARVGYNRININFDPNVVVNPADLGINNGINVPLALPQITDHRPRPELRRTGEFPAGPHGRHLGGLRHRDLPARATTSSSSAASSGGRRWRRSPTTPARSRIRASRHFRPASATRSTSRSAIARST